MKKLLAAFVVMLALAASAKATESCTKTDADKQGKLPTCLALDGVAATASSAIIDTFGHRFLSVRVWADEGASVNKVKIFCRSMAQNAANVQVVSPWTLCSQEIVNLDNTTRDDQYVTLPRAYQYRIDVTEWTSGTISAIFERATQ